MTDRIVLRRIECIKKLLNLRFITKDSTRIKGAMVTCLRCFLFSSKLTRQDVIQIKKIKKYEKYLTSIYIICFFCDKT